MLYCWPRTADSHKREEDMPLLFHYISTNKSDISALSKLFDACITDEKEGRKVMAQFMASLQTDDCHGDRLGETMCVFMHALTTCEVMMRLQHEHDEDDLMATIVDRCLRQLCSDSQDAEDTTVIMHWGFQLLW